MSGIFLSWAREHGRTSELAAEFGLRAKFVYAPGKGGLLARYVRQFRQTRALLLAERPEVVWVQLPPALALFALSRVSGYRPTVVADLHTGFFLDPKWRWATRRSLAWLRKRGALAVVTNTYLQQRCERSGVTAVVLHDLIRDSMALPAHGHVLCPLSYANDEPLAELLHAAWITPEISWVFTGAPPAKVCEAAPPNVRFTGYLSRDEYTQELRTASALCALTTRPHTMQRAGYEALEYGIPLVTSDFAELREFFGDAAEYVRADAEAIAKGAGRALLRKDELRASMREIRPSLQLEQQRTLDILRATLHGQNTGTK